MIRGNRVSDYLLQEQRNITILSTISDLIASKENLFDLFNEVRRYIKIIIPCDFVSIILNNEKSRYFYLIPALYDEADRITEEIIIHYNETALTEILRTRGPMNRIDLAVRGALTPGDLKFIEEDIESDIAVPVFHDKRIVAIIHASSYESQGFNEMHQELLEEIAVLASLAIDRIYLREDVKELKEDVSIWKKKYQALLNFSNDPIALLSNDLSFIYDANEKFEELSGYTSAQLNGLTFSQIHPKLQAHLLNQIIKETRDGVKSSVKGFLLRHSNGTEISVNCKFAAVSDSKTPVVIAIYDSTNIDDQHPSDISLENEFSLSNLAILTKSEVDTSDMIDDLSLLACHAGKLCNAKYVIIHAVDNNIVESQLLCAKQHPFSYEADLDLPVCISLNEGPYQSIVEGGERVFFRDVFCSDEFFEWLSIAQNINYRAFASFPLKSRTQIIGLMSIFWTDVNESDDDLTESLNHIASMMTMVMTDYQLMRKQLDHDRQFAIMKELANSIFSAEKIDHLFKNITAVIDDLFGCDLYMLTLFDGSPERYNTYAIASQRYGHLFDPKAWNPFDEDRYGWLEIPDNYNSGKGRMNSVNKWSHKLQSTINTLLLFEGKYIGTLTLSSMDPDMYSNEQRMLLEQLCPLISLGIHTVMIKDEMTVYRQTLHEMDRLCRDLTLVAEPSTIIRELLTATQSIFHAAFCSYAEIRKNIIDYHMFATDSSLHDSDMRKFEEHLVIPGILETNEAIVLTDVTAKGQRLGLLNFNYSSYIGIPLIDSDVLFGLINIYMGNPGKIDDYKLTFINVLSNRLSLLRSIGLLRNEYTKAVKRLGNTNRDLDRLLNSMTHNLKSYIDAIQGFSAIMLDDMRTMLNDENKMYLYRIRDYADRMEFYMRDLSELANIDRVPNKYEEVDTGEILDLVLSEYVFDIENKKVKIEVPRQLPTIYCDKKRMLIVFNKLIENALQYIDTTKDQPIIKITYAEDNFNYTFHMNDNGIGLSDDSVIDIFTLFYSVENDSTEIQNNGLGLPIVKRIIESHNGTIDVISKPGIGSTFYFSIPKNISTVPA